jgi:hypothetical protein
LSPRTNRPTTQPGTRFIAAMIDGHASQIAPSTSPTRTHPPANPTALPSSGPRQATMKPSTTRKIANMPSVVRRIKSQARKADRK